MRFHQLLELQIFVRKKLPGNRALLMGIRGHLLGQHCPTAGQPLGGDLAGLWFLLLTVILFDVGLVLLAKKGWSPERSMELVTPFTIVPLRE